MKALTICQPYAELILRGEKRVENRTWAVSTAQRPLPLIIHAGKSRAWFDDDAQLIREFGVMPPFGAIVGTATVIDCVRSADVIMGDYKDQYPWLLDHEHMHGPWCWILADVERVSPIPYRGAQGLFDIPDSELAGSERFDFNPHGDGERCYYCDSLDAHFQRDHFPIPASLGGTHTVRACLHCHNMKDRVSASMAFDWAIGHQEPVLSSHEVAFLMCRASLLPGAFHYLVGDLPMMDPGPWRVWVARCAAMQLRDIGRAP